MNGLFDEHTAFICAVHLGVAVSRMAWNEDEIVRWSRSGGLSSARRLTPEDTEAEDWYVVGRVQ